MASRDIARWSELEARALEPNAYLSAHVVRASARFLTPENPPVAYLLERQAAGGVELVGVAVLTAVAAGRRFPLRRLVGYTTGHSVVGGLLLQADVAEQALPALLGHLRRHAPRTAVLEFPLVWADGATAQLCRERVAGAAGPGWLRQTDSRAVLAPAGAATQLRSRALADRLRDLARRMRRLRERGEVAWRWHCEDGIAPAVVEDFLRLEHLGWKRERGTSLRSRASTEQFFRDMVAGLERERRVFFTELTLDGAVIASSCNLLSGNLGFAYKIGWDPQQRSFSPGWLNEVELMRHAAERLPGVAFIDSGAAEESFINELWLERRPLATLALPLGVCGRMALGVEHAARTLKRRLPGAGGRAAGAQAAGR